MVNFETTGGTLDDNREPEFGLRLRLRGRRRRRRHNPNPRSPFGALNQLLPTYYIHTLALPLMRPIFCRPRGIGPAYGLQTGGRKFV